MAGERLTPPLLRKQLPRRLQCQARAVLSEVHADRTGFRSYLAGAGRIEHDTPVTPQNQRAYLASLVSSSRANCFGGVNT
jgi:hypothetical protein